MNAIPGFASLAFPQPTRESLAADRAAVDALLDAGDLPGALAAWDHQRRAYDSWSALVHLRFAQDTTDEAAKAAREYADALAPAAAEHETALKRRLLAWPDRPALDAAAGAFARAAAAGLGSADDSQVIRVYRAPDAGPPRPTTGKRP